MVYYIGDIHGQVSKVLDAIHNCDITSNDIIVILGDAGLNYFGNEYGDADRKKILNEKEIKILCVHGNHEKRPATINSYTTQEWNGGTIYYEKEYPNILFAKDGEIYNLEGARTIVIGGAYSVDKFYRIANRIAWFEDEQPSEEIKNRVEAVLKSENWEIDQVLSHTCPTKYIPWEAALPGIDQSRVDNSTEQWLDTIEDRLKYKRWLCGHWHIDKTIDKMRFVMYDTVT